MKEEWRKRFAILDYCKDKLPPKWEIHDYGYLDDGTEVPDVIYLIGSIFPIPYNHIWVPIIMVLDKPDVSAQVILHTAWGLEEQGYEVWL